MLLQELPQKCILLESRIYWHHRPSLRKSSRLDPAKRRLKLLGTSLSNKIAVSLGTKSGTLFESLATKLGIAKEELALYELSTEVPLITANGFMKADIMLVKRSTDGSNTVEDVILIENKLSAGTDYTVRQKEGWEKVANGQTLDIKYKAGTLETSDGPLSLNKAKVFKFSDGGTDDITKVSISLVPVDKYK